jgi:competence protein ComFC
LTYYWDFNSIARKLIIRGKYKFNKKVFEYLSEIVKNHYGHTFNNSDAYIYVPTTYLRYCFRGFNQAKVISKELNSNTMSCLKRLKYTKSQIKNSETARKNRGKLFAANKWKCKRFEKILLAEKIIIVDDVCTTGATLFGCAEAILELYPSVKIEFTTLAYRTKFSKN